MSVHLLSPVEASELDEESIRSITTEDLAELDQTNLPVLAAITCQALVFFVSQDLSTSQSCNQRRYHQCSLSRTPRKLTLHPDRNPDAFDWCEYSSTKYENHVITSRVWDTTILKTYGRKRHRTNLSERIADDGTRQGSHPRGRAILFRRIIDRSMT